MDQILSLVNTLQLLSLIPLMNLHMPPFLFAFLHSLSFSMLESNVAEDLFLLCLDEEEIQSEPVNPTYE